MSSSNYLFAKGTFSLKEISKKYDLSVMDVQEVIEKTISEVISEVLECDADYTLGENQIYLYGDKEKIIFPTKDIKKNIIRLIKFRLENTLQSYSTIKRCLIDKRLTGTIVGGYVAKINNGTIYVEINSDHEMPLGICRLSHQTPKERGKYKINEYYHFFVNKISLTAKNGVPYNEISLSRTSKGLVCGLLRKELSSRFIDDITVVCKRRLAGIRSEVNVNKKIPKECIKAVQKELREMIIVRYY